MKRGIRLVALMLAAGLSLTGCKTRLCDFTVLSTKNVPYRLSSKGAGCGEDIARIIVVIPTKAQPNLKEALDQAIEQRGGDVLMNAKIYTENWYIPYIYGQSGFTVKGDVCNTREEWEKRHERSSRP